MFTQTSKSGGWGEKGKEQERISLISSSWEENKLSLKSLYAYKNICINTYICVHIYVYICVNTYKL